MLALPTGNVEQAVGRIRRPCDAKIVPVRIVDVVDTFSIFVYMARKRLKYYNVQKFDVVDVSPPGVETYT